MEVFYSNLHFGQRCMESWAWLNGDFVPEAKATLSIHDQGFIWGVTTAERLRTFRGKLFRLDDHLRRLADSLETIGLDCGFTPHQFADVANELVENNHRQLHPGDDLGLTLFVTPGLPDGGPTVCLHTVPLPFHQWAAKYRDGQRLTVSSFRQVPPECWPPQLKCRSRMHYWLADREAAAKEPGSRALMLDIDGFVTETSTANLVLWNEREGLVSPPQEKILPGISVAMLADLAAQSGYAFVHRDLTPDDVANAAEVMLCSTSPCVWPVVLFAGKPVGTGQPGTVFQRLLAAWSDEVGVDIAAQSRQFSTRS